MLTLEQQYSLFLIDETLNETGMYLIFITFIAQLKSSLANVLTQLRWFHTFSPQFQNSLHGACRKTEHCWIICVKQKENIYNSWWVSNTPMWNCFAQINLFCSAYKRCYMLLFASMCQRGQYSTKNKHFWGGNTVMYGLYGRRISGWSPLLVILWRNKAVHKLSWWLLQVIYQLQFMAMGRPVHKKMNDGLF